MDLRELPRAGTIDERQVLGLPWYQPYFFSDSLATGVAGSWFIPGLTQTVLKRDQSPEHFARFWKMNQRLARMYQDWILAFCRLAPVDLGSSSVLDVACNTGYFLYELKRRGAGACVGVDPADLAAQRKILSEVTGIRDIEFRRSRYSSSTHTLESMGSSESYDLVVALFIAQHLSDPLHFLREISRRTRKALLFETLTFPDFPYGMAIRYIPNLPHHQKWGDSFPDNFDTWISRGLLLHSLKACGFKRIVPLPYRPSWLPWGWYRWHLPVVCVK